MEAFLEFRGEDGSMGLKTGRTYPVRLSTARGFFWVEWTEWNWPMLPPRRLVRCPYQSLEAFARNWKIPGK